MIALPLHKYNKLDLGNISLQPPVFVNMLICRWTILIIHLLSYGPIELELVIHNTIKKACLLR